MPGVLGHYRNGNTDVVILEDGTKIRETKDDEFDPVFPEATDVKITNFCPEDCAFCHEDSGPNGVHGDILGAAFFDSLQPFSELAIGGGCPLSHPDLIPFLVRLKTKQVIANVTISQNTFMANYLFVKQLVTDELIRGLGISFRSIDEQFIEHLVKFPNVVLHVINGVADIAQLATLYGKDLKILILGYKQLRRGLDFYSKEVERRKHEMDAALPAILKGFKVVSFDNLALEQLDVRRLMTPARWKLFYQGDDGKGTATMYVDVVRREFARSSTSNLRYPLLDNITDMFATIKAETS